jgi:hypothetical protein
MRLALVLRNLPSGRHSEETKRERPAGCTVFGENTSQCQNIPHGSKGTGATGFINISTYYELIDSTLATTSCLL